jgi:hypothetical protein
MAYPLRDSLIHSACLLCLCVVQNILEGNLLSERFTSYSMTTARLFPGRWAVFSAVIPSLSFLAPIIPAQPRLEPLWKSPKTTPKSSCKEFHIKRPKAPISAVFRTQTAPFMVLRTPPWYKGLGVNPHISYQRGLWKSDRHARRSFQDITISANKSLAVILTGRAGENRSEVHEKLTPARPQNSLDFLMRYRYNQRLNSQISVTEVFLKF